MSADLAASLARSLGADAVESHAAIELDGVTIGTTLHPVDADALADSIGTLARERLCAVPRGAGRHLALGNPPSRADVFLSTARLSGVDVFEPGEGVCHALAGTPLREVREIVAAASWELPLDAPDAATLGGALSAALLGPRAHGFGPPRDAVLGLEVVTGDGARTRCGGRVVKNVTGYDLAKLYTGALGTLGVIEGAWLRLRPKPEHVCLVGVPQPGLVPGCAFATRASRHSAARACVLHGDGDAGFECLVELAGDLRAVEACRAELGGELRPDAVLDEAAGARSASGEGDLAVRIAALPSELPDVLTILAEAGARVVAQPGLRLVDAVFARADAASISSARRAAARASGPLRIERAPLAIKRESDVFGASPIEARLFAALKSQLDPQGVLSPGRFAGGA